MLDSFVTGTLRFAAIAFPLAIPLFFYNRLFTLSRDSQGAPKELAIKDEVRIVCAFLVAMVVAFTVPPIFQWLLFRAVPSGDSLFSWRLSHGLIFPVGGYVIQGLAVALLLHFLIAKCIFRGRFEAEIFRAKPRRRHSYDNAYSFGVFVDPGGKIRVMLWLGALVATIANIASEGTYLRIDHQSVQQNILWVDEDRYPITSIQRVTLTPHYGRHGYVTWFVDLHLKNRQAIPLLGGLGEFPAMRAKQLTQILKATSNESIEIHESTNRR